MMWQIAVLGQVSSFGHTLACSRYILARLISTPRPVKSQYLRHSIRHLIISSALPLGQTRTSDQHYQTENLSRDEQVLLERFLPRLTHASHALMYSFPRRI